MKVRKSPLMSFSKGGDLIELERLSKLCNILAIGDVIGKPGRQTVQKLLPGLRKQYELDLVIANGENAAGGLGLTVSTAKELLDAGVDILTSGNHIWDQKEIIPYLDGDLPILRPLNYPSGRREYPAEVV